MSPIKLGIIAVAVTTFIITVVKFAHADPHYTDQYQSDNTQSVPNPANPWAGSIYAGWADEQQVMPAAKTRLGCASPSTYCSCCNGAEIVKSKFRPIKSEGSVWEDGWEWLNLRTNEWERVPDDIIHWGEPTPDKKAVAFEYPIGSGRLRCFFPPQGEGG